MLRTLPLRLKLLSLPVASSLVFALVIGANLVLGGANRGYLDAIQRTSFPAYQSARDLETMLGRYQQVLQNAASAADRETLQQARELRRSIDGLLTEASSNAALAVSLPQVRAEWAAYATSAESVAASLVAGTEVRSDEIETMQARFSALKTRVETLTREQRESTEAAFAAAHRTSRNADSVNVACALVCVLVLVGLSVWVLRGVVGTLSSASNYVTAAAAEILAIAKQTETNATDEAAFVSETQRAMDGLVTAASEIQDGAGRVLQQAEQSASASRTVAEKITELTTPAERISEIADVIRSIADKSDMLALNASLEGSKAGEAGRGISLVGAEMRRLAESVGSAARQIRELSVEIRALSQSAVMATEMGQKLAAQTSETSRGISLITGQQRTATAQVTQSMREIQHFAQQAQAGAQQARSTAADLVRSTDEMSAIMTGATPASVTPAARVVAS